MQAYLEYKAPADLLEQRVILVTGAGSGIGRAAAKTFARHGATVVLLGRTESKLNEVYDEIINEGLPKPGIVPVNLETVTYNDLIQLAGMLESEFGKLDGLLHNASTLGSMTPLRKYPPDTWNTVMQVNVNAVFMLTQAMLPLLEKSGDASIIYTSSSVGRKGRAFWGAYGVSKFATEGLMQTLADEFENIPGIRVNAINPGATRTAMRAEAYPGEDPETLKTPDEIMPLYLFLAGTDSREVNGQSIDAQPK